MSDDQDYRTDPSAIQSFEDSDIPLKISVAVACVAIISVPIYLVLRGILSSLRKQLRDRKVEPEPYETRSVKSTTPSEAPVRPKTSPPPPPPPPCLPPPPPPVLCTEEAHVPITFVTQPQPRQPQEREEAHVPIKFVAKPQPREEEEEAHVPIAFSTKPQPKEKEKEDDGSLPTPTPKEVILPIQYKVKSNEPPSRSLQQQQQPPLSKESPPQPYETQVQPTQSAPVVYKQPQQEPQAYLPLPSQKLDPVPEVAMTGSRPVPINAMKEVPQQPPYKQTAFKVNSEYLSMQIQPDPAPSTKYESKTVITATSPTAPRSEPKRQRLQLEPVILEPVQVQTRKVEGGPQITVPVRFPVPRSGESTLTQRETVSEKEPIRIQTRKAKGGYQSALPSLKSIPSKDQSETVRNLAREAEEVYQTTVPISTSEANKTQPEPVRIQGRGALVGSQPAVLAPKSKPSKAQPEQDPKPVIIQSQKADGNLESFKAPVPTPTSESHKLPSFQPEMESARVQTRKAEGGYQPPLSSPRSEPNKIQPEPVRIQARDAVVGSQPAVVVPKSKPSKAQEETVKNLAREAEEVFQTTVPISRSEASKTQPEPVRIQAREAFVGSQHAVLAPKSEPNKDQPEQTPEPAPIQSQETNWGLESFKAPIPTLMSEPNKLPFTQPETESARIQTRKAEGGYQSLLPSPKSEPNKIKIQPEPARIQARGTEESYQTTVPVPRSNPNKLQPEPVAEPEPVRIQSRKADGSYQPVQSPRPEPDQAQSSELAFIPTRKTEGSRIAAVPTPIAVPNKTQPEVVPESESESVKTQREYIDGNYQIIVSAPVISTPNNKRQSRLERLEPEPLRILTRGEGGSPIHSKTIKELELPAKSPVIPFIMSESRTTHQSRAVNDQPTTYERPMTAAANNLSDAKITSVKTHSKTATTRIPIIIDPKELSNLPTKQIPMRSSVSMKQDHSKTASPPMLTPTPTKQRTPLPTPSQAETATGSLIIPPKPKKLGPRTTQIERTTPATSLPYSALVSETYLRPSGDPLDEEEADYFPVVKASNVHTQPTRLSRAQLEPKRVHNLPTKQKPASLVVFLENDQEQDNNDRISSQSRHTKQLASTSSPAAPVKSIPRVGTTPSSPGPGAGRKQSIPSPSQQQQQQPKHYQFNATPRDNQQIRDRDRDSVLTGNGNADKLRRVSHSAKNNNSDKIGFVKRREYDGSEPPIIVVGRKRHAEDEDGEMMKGKPRMTQCEIFTSKDFPTNHGRRSSGSSGEREQQPKCSLDPPAPAHDDRNARSSGSCPVRRSMEKDAGCENKNKCKRTGAGPGHEGGSGK